MIQSTSKRLGRRGFLGALAAALVFDPERALWRPGEKLISIPKPQRYGTIVQRGDLIEVKLVNGMDCAVVYLTPQGPTHPRPDGSPVGYIQEPDPLEGGSQIFHVTQPMKVIGVSMYYGNKIHRDMPFTVQRAGRA